MRFDESVGLGSISKSQSHTDKIDYKEAEPTSVPPASETLPSQLSEAADVLFAAASGPPEIPSYVSEAEPAPVTAASGSSVPPASQTLPSQLSEAADVLFAAASGPPEVLSYVSEAEPAPVTAASGSSQGSEVGASDKLIILKALTDFNVVLSEYRKLSQTAIENEIDDQERIRRVGAVKDAVKQSSNFVRLVLKEGHPVTIMKDCQKMLAAEVSELKREVKRFERKKKRN